MLRSLQVIGTLAVVMSSVPAFAETPAGGAPTTTTTTTTSATTTTKHRRLGHRLHKKACNKGAAPAATPTSTAPAK